MGATVTGEYRLPDTSTPYPATVYIPKTFVVANGLDSQIIIEGLTTFNVDFADTSLSIVFDTILPGNNSLISPSFNGLVFTSNAFALITGLSVDASTNLAGFDASRVSIVGDEMRLNLGGLTYNTDTALALTFTSNRAAIPEPASWMMMTLGCGFVGGAMRYSRRRQRTVASFA